MNESLLIFEPQKGRISTPEFNKNKIRFHPGCFLFLKEIKRIAARVYPNEQIYSRMHSGTDISKNDWPGTEKYVSDGKDFH